MRGLVSNTTLHSRDVRRSDIGIGGDLISLQTPLSLRENSLGEADVKALIHPLTNGKYYPVVLTIGRIMRAKRTLGR